MAANAGAVVDNEAKVHATLFLLGQTSGVWVNAVWVCSREFENGTRPASKEDGFLVARSGMEVGQFHDRVCLSSAIYFPSYSMVNARSLERVMSAEMTKLCRLCSAFGGV